MKTLIINGSPRPKGDTASLVRRLADHLNGEVKIVDAYRCNISPCVDCRYCWQNEGCAISDDMQEIYDYLENCNNIVIASPVYFSELTGKTLDFGSRFQTYFCARFFRKSLPKLKAKRGGIILVGGGDGSMEKAADSARILLRHVNCNSIFSTVSYHNTNSSPAITDTETLALTDKLAQFLNQNLSTDDIR